MYLCTYFVHYPYFLLKAATLHIGGTEVQETNSVTINSTPDNPMVDQSLQSDGSMTVWVVVTILFIVIAVLAITLSIFVGYFSHKKIRTLKNSLAAISATHTKELLTEGKFTCNKLNS